MGSHALEKMEAYFICKEGKTFSVSFKCLKEAVAGMKYSVTCGLFNTQFIQANKFNLQILMFYLEI